ncbi:MAG: TetR/AcrR family transcriptional regulator, partial [Chloroflexi bacterium]|nr:TetR/AcrR family transcriptional regulator [Chloroflexota bacterium]
IEFLIREQMRSMNAMGVTAATQYFKNQLMDGEKYIVDKERFFYRTILENVQQAIGHGALRGEAGAITDDVLSLTRGRIYDWCLHDGNYDLVASGLRTLEMALQYYAVAAP